jgi:ABC-type molybdenum transport system ATPase subunit/photorepair protein PhrA
MATDNPSSIEPLSLTAVVKRSEEIRSRPKAHLAWLHIHSLDDLRDQRVRFDPSINVVLGKNGVGKTTLLNVLAAALGRDFRSWSTRSFDVEYRFELGEWFWHYRVKNVRDPSRDHDGRAGYRPEVTLRVRFEEIAFEIESDDRELRRTINRSTERFEGVGLLTAFLVAGRAGDPWSNTTMVAMAPCSFDPVLSRFDEGLDTFRAVLAQVADDRPMAFTKQASERHVWRGSRSALGVIGRPSRLVDLDAILEDPTRPVRLSSEQLGISQAFLDALGATELFADLGLPEIRSTDEETSISLSQLAFFMKRANGDVLRHTSWSWGQQRLVAFALYLAEHRSYVVADELVNGMHHEWIELCLREVGDRQCFITSQNPILVDFVSLTSAQQIERAFVLCEVRESKPGRTARTWRNMTEREAQTLFDARSVGLQSTSEIMRFHGWW